MAEMGSGGIAELRIKRIKNEGEGSTLYKKFKEDNLKRIE